MWSNLLILHSNDKNRDRESFHGLHHWKTCMRTLYIGDIRIFDLSQAQFSRHYEAYVGYEAYKLLLEIVSGIRSRLLGETEILAQFKETLKNEALPEHSLGDYLKKLRDQIIEDSRKIRSGHLRFLGDQSYGGLANRYLKNTKEVTLFGTGNLAVKVLPWLLEKNRKVKVVGRNLEKLKDIASKFPVQIQTLDEYKVADEAIVIAAPISMKEWIPSFSEDKIIIDFREDDKKDDFSKNKNYISFEFMLNSLKAQEERNAELRKKLDVVIQELAAERENESINFIYGWEDIPCLSH
ncbi:MAG TPA: NAD(P)-binding domain-containing protein [Leptospiraceae bacterium]|nr:NAD(P)-binding domain-containing protein [Leptospiraceae bacterium]HMX33234.1 NAD(P)-binding domain-containing protein [Leptospiraceae bacterium]HMY32869.1 NAD(P)-binding domain-containing protein [Leptospiraceae bacterium]HMZ66080.1 NAD(P)-binding domain-containing protein [Leptospiraceae bacterium]HNA07012.1 NAD(P)-binding domain-containing protein [Leptospiraceae bacterium]